MNRFETIFFIAGCLSAIGGGTAFASVQTDSVTSLQEVVVRQRQGVTRMRGKAENSQLITSAELKRAACCNLGESFTTNPSVDVSYSDAATGARQIRLLGLSGTYVQMLTENIPNLRGAAAPFGLSYIPGPWMQSIQVSKGASSVKNGYESLTGQINIEFLKPQSDPSLQLNAYVDHLGKLEANATGNINLSDRTSTGLLLHGEHSTMAHDSNGDSFADMPKVSQFSAMNRWAWMGDNYVFQAGAKYMYEDRSSGQITDGHSHGHTVTEPYLIGLRTNRIEGFTKNAYFFDKENDGNVALILSATRHDLDATYGLRTFGLGQTTLYGSLMFERKWSDAHSLSAGLSVNYDHVSQSLASTTDIAAPVPAITPVEQEWVPGGYVQYTLDLDKKLLVMAGLRYDYSSVYGSMVTPRFHMRWNPVSQFTLNISAGRGFRSPHVLAENHFLLASSRRIILADNITREDGFNTGATASTFLNVAGKTLNLNAEYYYTRFRHQLTLDLDSDPHAAIFSDIKGGSRSHTFQIEATYPFFEDFTFTAAYRLTDVKADYGKGMVEKPLTSRDKWLATASWAPMMGLWQFDLTLAVNGPGRMPDPYELPDGSLSWQQRFKAYPTLNFQATRNFRHWSIYLGGENLTGYRQKNPIMGADNPFGPDFDATMVYGPMHGATVYAGFRFNISKY